MNPNNATYIVKYKANRVKYNKCINCEKEFSLNEDIVSKNMNGTRGYYCKECAERLYIV
jgi:DNA-directed RNA polymerase subunit RPC12/RpoP